MSVKNGFRVTTKQTGKIEGTVFMAIDTGGSMRGEKIQEVSSAVKDIIRQCPNYVRFVIRKFDMKVTTIVSKKKKYLDIDRLLGDLRICGHRTALYDGIGQTINEIPYSYSQLNVTHVLAFTDGCDNASKNYTLDSMINLLNQTARFGNLQFTFIQAGNDTTVTNALEAQCTKHCTVLKVEDSVKGIKMGFSRAKESIKLSFTLTMPSNESLLRDMGKLQIDGLPGPGGSVSLNINPRQPNSRTKFPPGGMDFSYVRPLSSCLPMLSYPHLTHLLSPPSFCQPLVQPPTMNNFSHVTPNGQVSSRPGRKKKNNFPPKTTFSNVEQTLGCSTSKKEKQALKSNLLEKGSQSAPNEKGKLKKDTGAGKSSFLIWTGNISKSAKESDILEFFTQWGECSVYRVEELTECRCAVISYTEEKASQLAVKYGNGNSFLHSERKLKVFKY